MKLLSILFVFFITINFRVYTGEEFPIQDLIGHKSIARARDFTREFPVQLQEGLPAYFLHYVHYQMEILQGVIGSEVIKKRAREEDVKQYFRQLAIAESISNIFLMNRLPIDFDFDIKYKKIKKTKGERPHPLLNYLAREPEITEGFEAGETLLSYYRVTRHIRLLSKITLFEKWVTEREHYEEAHHLEHMSEEIQQGIEKITGTIKYGLGWVWDIPMKRERKISVEFLMQQRTYNQWHVQERVIQNFQGSGAAFDHWVLTFTLDF